MGLSQLEPSGLVYGDVPASMEDKSLYLSPVFQSYPRGGVCAFGNGLPVEMAPLSFEVRLLLSAQ